MAGGDLQLNLLGDEVMQALSPSIKTAPSLLDQPLVFVDIETNGHNHIRGRVIEVAAIRVEGGKVTRVFNQLIDPGSDIPAFITSLTGIRNQDLRGAITFHQAARELHDILSGALFVAHNVRFDYSFLKQEFKRAGLTFLPKQLCTVKLSRVLYPQYKSHKLESLIQRHGFSFTHRHRAYDDAFVLWQFIQHVTANFPAEVVHAAVARQLRQPAIPGGISPDLVKGLPETPGVYIFEDDKGKPLYIGKSINIKKRVLSHFGHDHDDGKEFKIAQSIRNISTLTTGGELEALLLESQMVKEMQPLYNRKLRRTQKLLLARQTLTGTGYVSVTLEEAHAIEPEDITSTLAVYTHRGKAKSSLIELQKMYELCPKLLGLEKGKGACFLSQLRKCGGACAGRETAESYNRRVALAFERQRLQAWPYGRPVLLQEMTGSGLQSSSGIIVDQWCVVGEVQSKEACDTEVKWHPKIFDLDTYKILQAFMETKRHKLHIRPFAWNGGGHPA
ncbi:MAG TPA: exonuclease domain-containing protein [Candidatus Saccharimonadales bacterium]|nr:exonuclease domain-containing protein [Candidatus Saccharimonadales bacterium]